MIPAPVPTSLASPPPILDEGQPDEEKINVGELTEAGWQPITITFSETPKTLFVQKPHALVSQWALKGSVLIIRTFCDYRWYPGQVFTYRVTWDAGYIELNYKCPD